MADDEGFLSRWSRRKGEAKTGAPVDAPKVEVATAVPVVTPVPAPHPDPLPRGERESLPELPSPPTLDDVAQLTHASDYSRFVAPNVDIGVKNAAMKKLFSDPHFNVMDGLDIYIDDYSKPDPIPASMLRQMVQSKFLGLFDDEEKEEQQRLAQAAPGANPESAALPAPDNPVPDENTDLRLQQDDAAGRPGADQGARPREG